MESNTNSSSTPGQEPTLMKKLILMLVFNAWL